MEKHNERIDAVFHALSDSTRRTILDELSKREDQKLFEICVRLIEGHGLSLTRQAISKHLKVLEAAGLVATRWNGRTGCEQRRGVVRLRRDRGRRWTCRAERGVGPGAVLTKGSGL